ncbi:hypothetical protein ACSQ67_015738 [Phaseolus vulgaris]
MGGLKASKIELVRKKVWVPFSIHSKGLKGSKLALVRSKVKLKNGALICELNFKIYRFRRKQVIYLKRNSSFI